jgi:DNA-binding transcriptional LysR family regulator
MDWNDLRYLLELHRAGTLVGAARALKVNHTTVSRRLAALEEALGVRLFIRSGEGVRFTVAGDAVLQTAMEVEQSCLGLERRIAGGDARPEGIVRITAPEGLGLLIMTGLARLREKHPELQVDVVSNNARVDLARGDADIALRMFKETQPDLVARLVGQIGWSLYASQDYVARRGPLDASCSLDGREVIGFDAGGTHVGHRWLSEHAQKARFVMRGNSTLSVTSAAVAGMGIAILPCVMAAETRLQRLTPKVLARNDAWAVFHMDLRWAARIRLVVEQLEELFSDRKALLSGETEESISSR